MRNRIAAFITKHQTKALCLLTFLALSLSAKADGDTNVALVTAGVTSLTTVFATVFALGVGVVIAMIAKKYLRRAS